MAIAPVVDTGMADWAGEAVEAPFGTRHALQLVPGVGTRERPWNGGNGEHGGNGGHGSNGAHARGSRPRAAAPVEQGAAVGDEVASRDARREAGLTQHRPRRVAALRRRRAVVLAGVAGGLVCGLALPFAALGGSPAAPGTSVAALSASAAAGSASGAAPGETIYVVRPGDTLWSIASRFDHGGDPRPLAEALARETGSAVVVPGERIAIP